MRPESPEIPSMKGTSTAGLKQSLAYGLRLPGLPGMETVAGMTEARRIQAAKLAQEMGIAFAYSRAQNKMSSKRAKAKGKAAQRAAERR